MKLFFTFVVTTSVWLHAIQGIVEDPAGNGIEGALIAVEGTDFFTETDANGKFTIEGATRIRSPQRIAFGQGSIGQTNGTYTFSGKRIDSPSQAPFSLALTKNRGSQSVESRALAKRMADLPNETRIFVAHPDFFGTHLLLEDLKADAVIPLQSTKDFETKNIFATSTVAISNLAFEGNALQLAAEDSSRVCRSGEWVYEELETEMKFLHQGNVLYLWDEEEEEELCEVEILVSKSGDLRSQWLRIGYLSPTPDVLNPPTCSFQDSFSEPIYLGGHFDFRPESPAVKWDVGVCWAEMMNPFSSEDLEEAFESVGLSVEVVHCGQLRYRHGDQTMTVTVTKENGITGILVEMGAESCFSVADEGPPTCTPEDEDISHPNDTPFPKLPALVTDCRLFTQFLQNVFPPGSS